MTMTLPIQKPGAPDTLLATSAPPSGMRVMRMRASLSSPPILARRSFRMATASGWKSQRHAEGLGDAVGGDVVVRRADAAGGEHVGVARAQGIYGADDLGFYVGHNPDFTQVDAEGGEVFGDVADVLVLGPPRQDFVADDKDRRGDDLGCRHGAHCLSSSGKAEQVARPWGSLKRGKPCAAPLYQSKSAQNIGKHGTVGSSPGVELAGFPHVVPDAVLDVALGLKIAVQ